ncbi:DUF1800 domain-containing protein [Kamptonema cortianum]|nr:DUF1800 domain-containing protein [Geitlerinema splendidum]MDK3158785.1 DUF1800 domain-containing protein [Kamptonema cortianum]
MKLSRRDAILAAGAVASTGMLVGCGRLASGLRTLETQPLLPPQPKDDPLVALIDRFGFGPSASSMHDLRELGADRWFESQLNPSNDEPAHLSTMLNRLDINHLGPFDLRDWKEEAVIAQMHQAAILRATYSPWQVRERMVDFWTNHFNIYAKKGLGAYRKPHDERTVIRANALGKFGDMVRASAHSTAMLVYLDQQNSNAANPNENYARELLELHTLGVDGGYTQGDVMEVARCFTGWTEERRFLKKRGAFRFRPELHDDGEKIVLGHRIPAGGGDSDGERVIDIVVNHPATARHVTRKLATAFLGEPSPALLERLAKVFLETRGDIKALLRELKSEFVAQPRPVVKRPFDYVVSALRAVSADTDGGVPIHRALERMGQPLYLWPMPDGYPTEATSWTGSMLGRWNFAFSLTENQMKGTRVEIKKLARNLEGFQAFQSVFHLPESDPLAESTAKHVRELDLRDQVAALLASPEFQWR